MEIGWITLGILCYFGYNVLFTIFLYNTTEDNSIKTKGDYIKVAGCLLFAPLVMIGTIWLVKKKLM